MISWKLTKKFSSARRVVVTGLGMVSPMGVNVQSSWNALLQEKCPIINLKEHEPYKNDPYIPDVAAAPVHKDFDHKKWSKLTAPNMITSFAMSAAEEALIDANWLPKTEEDQLKTGVSIGPGVNLADISKIITKVVEKKNYDFINRIAALHQAPIIVPAQVALKFGIKGYMNACLTACASGAMSIMDGFRAIKFGDADVMVVGTSAHTINPPWLHAMIKLEACSITKYDDPTKSSKPFDQDRDGMILGEGSGMLVIEELEHALNRKAKIYAELAGYGCSVEADHLARPAHDGDGTRRAMINATKKAGISPKDIDHVNAHATSTPAGDQAEANAIADFLGHDEHLMKKVTVTANKGTSSHCHVASAGMETVFTILSIHNEHVPSIKNLTKPIGTPKLNFVTNKNHHQKINYALKNGVGLGGVGVSLLFRKFPSS